MFKLEMEKDRVLNWSTNVASGGPDGLYTSNRSRGPLSASCSWSGGGRAMVPIMQASVSDGITVTMRRRITRGKMKARLRSFYLCRVTD